jgi:hypothetical protein
MENGFVTQAVGCKSGERHFLPAPARFSGPGKVRAAGLRRDREVFEGEDHTAETSASGGLSLQSVRACYFDALQQRWFPLNLGILSFPEQMANAICH